jgi:hypothetical protein
MARNLAVAALAVLGLLSATGIGLAAYLVSRDSVAVAVTRLQPRPRQLAPEAVERARRERPRTVTSGTTATTTVDDHGGNRGSGGGDHSGRGGDGHDGDDD